MTAHSALFPPASAVIVAEPEELAVSIPPAETLTTPGSLLLQLTAPLVAPAGETAESSARVSPLRRVSAAALRLTLSTGTALTVTAQSAVLF